MNKLEARKILLEQGVQVSNNQIENAAQSMNIDINDYSEADVQRIAAHFKSTARSTSPKPTKNKPAGGKPNTAQEHLVNLRRSEALAIQKAETSRRKAIVEDVIEQEFSDEILRHQSRTKTRQMIEAATSLAIESDEEIIEAQIESEQSFDELFGEVAADFFGSMPLQLPGGTYQDESITSLPINGEVAA